MKKDREQRAKLHNCDGRCYWSTGMCPKVEVCEETRTKEFACTVIAALIVYLIPIVIIAGVIVFLVDIFTVI